MERRAGGCAATLNNQENARSYTGGCSIICASHHRPRSLQGVHASLESNQAARRLTLNKGSSTIGPLACGQNGIWNSSPCIYGRIRGNHGSSGSFGPRESISSPSSDTYREGRTKGHKAGTRKATQPAELYDPERPAPTGGVARKQREPQWTPVIGLGRKRVHLSLAGAIPNHFYNHWVQALVDGARTPSREGVRRVDQLPGT